MNCDASFRDDGEHTQADFHYCLLIAKHLSATSLCETICISFFLKKKGFTEIPGKISATGSLDGRDGSFETK